MSETNSGARKRQLIVGLVSGAITGTVVSAFTQFWWWLPAGIVFGVITGMMMRPPEQK